MFITCWTGPDEQVTVDAEGGPPEPLEDIAAKDRRFKMATVEGSMVAGDDNVSRLGWDDDPVGGHVLRAPASATEVEDVVRGIYH